MPNPVIIPRINNNDDVVKLSLLLVELGAAVKRSDQLAEIETDKATFTIEAEQDGFVLRIDQAVGDTCEVGSTLLWLGAEADEVTPGASQQNASNGRTASPTFKALLLLKQYGLEAGAVPFSGERLGADDIEAYVRQRGHSIPAKRETTPRIEEGAPSEAGRSQPLSPQERGMLRAVSWHRDQAVPGYIEFPYEPGEWDEFSAAFQREHKLMMSPLLSLMAWQLAQVAARYPKLNATISAGQLYLYDNVNVGFTVQSGELLLMPVVRAAQTLDARSFVEALGALQRQAMKHSLKPEQTTGATVGFTSMARWGISRHMPILPRQTSLIVAHSAPGQNQAVLGACYDHRVLTGFDVARALRELAKPSQLDSPK